MTRKKGGEGATGWKERKGARKTASTRPLHFPSPLALSEKKREGTHRKRGGRFL